MDKKTIIIVVLLGLVIIFYYPILKILGLYEQPAPVPPQQTQDTTSVAQPGPADTGAGQPADVSEILTKPGATPAEIPDTLPVDTVRIETQLYTVLLSSRGGGPVSMELKEYQYRDEGNVEMIPEGEAATPAAVFAGGTYSTAALTYEASRPTGTYDATRDTLELTYRYTNQLGGVIAKTYYFYPNEYHYDLTFTVEKTSTFGFERSYTLWWNTPLGVTEEQEKADYAAMQAVTMQGGSREALQDYRGNQLNQSLDGNTDWVGLRSKFFTSVLIPRNRLGEAAVAAGSKQQISTEDGRVEIRHITAGVVMPFAGVEGVSDSFTVYVGPLDYLRMDNYGVNLQAMLDIGTMPYVGWILKPFAVAIMWLLPKLHDVVPNYGLVLFLFAVLVKVITLPLSMKQFKSMQGMREISPKLEKMREQYKKDPQALQRETMRLYKEHGVNPMSGCLVMLPQMPLMIAMFRVFQATILLRGESFVWFVDDLSKGASGFTDPLIALVVLMVITQLASSLLTMQTGGSGQQKALTYVFPIMLGFLLYSLPSGLILYWTAFSALSFVDWFLFKRGQAKNPQIKKA